MGNDNDKAIPPTLGPDQIIRSDTPHVVSFNERTGKAMSSAGGARSREGEDLARATESAKENAIGKDSTRVIADQEAPLVDRREKGDGAADSAANMQKAGPGSSGENIVVGLPRDAVMDTRVEGRAQGPDTDRLVNAPEELSATGDESALPGEAARRLDKVAADVNWALHDIRLEMDPVAPRKDVESTRPREAPQDAKIDGPRDGAQTDTTVAADAQNAIPSTHLTKPAESPEAVPSLVRSPSRAISDNLQAVEKAPADTSAQPSMVSRTEMRDNVQRAPNDHSRKEEPEAQADGREQKFPEAGGDATIDSEESATAVADTTAAAIAKLDSSALLKLSLGAETVVRMSQEQAQSQEISAKLEAIQKRLDRSKSRR